jgi:hypothetical protein
MHKRGCKKRAAEMHDEALFKALRQGMNARSSCYRYRWALKTLYFSCCGKMICMG